MSENELDKVLRIFYGSLQKVNWMFKITPANLKNLVKISPGIVILLRINYFKSMAIMIYVYV